MMLGLCMGKPSSKCMYDVYQIHVQPSSIVYVWVYQMFKLESCQFKCFPLASRSSKHDIQKAPKVIFTSLGGLWQLAFCLLSGDHMDCKFIARSSKSLSPTIIRQRSGFRYNWYNTHDFQTSWHCDKRQSREFGTYAQRFQKRFLLTSTES